MLIKCSFSSHPQYVKRSFHYDFALLELKSHIPFGDYPNIRPVCIPEDMGKTSPLNISL